ncbi:hypothetical protein LQK80_15740 [Bacillus thuringiensis]|nr:hypothetical protein [Bacillus thuringiensis]
MLKNIEYSYYNEYYVVIGKNDNLQTLGRKYIEKKKKLKPLAVLTTAAVLSSTFAFGGHAAYAETPTSSLPIDEHLIPEERLAEALKQRG